MRSDPEIKAENFNIVFSLHRGKFYFYDLVNGRKEANKNKMYNFYVFLSSYPIP